MGMKSQRKGEDFLEHTPSCSEMIVIRSSSLKRTQSRRSKPSSPPPDVPKGSFAVYVGQAEQEDQQRRFVVPISYLTHPLFLELLKKSEEEFGFRHDGAMHLPCHISVFYRVLQRIESERTSHRIKIPRGPIGLIVL